MPLLRIRGGPVVSSDSSEPDVTLQHEWGMSPCILPLETRRMIGVAAKIVEHIPKVGLTNMM